MISEKGLKNVQRDPSMRRSLPMSMLIVSLWPFTNLSLGRDKDNLILNPLSAYREGVV